MCYRFVFVLLCWALFTPTTGPAMEPVHDATMAVDLIEGHDWREHHFAMTNWFYNYHFDDPTLHIQLLKKHGYNGVMLSLKDDPKRWSALPEYLKAIEKNHLHLTAIHVRFYLEDGTYPQVIKDHLPRLKDTKVLLIPSVGSRAKQDRNDPQAVATAVRILREMSDDAQEYGLGGVAPYMHIGNWIETIDDNLRIARAVDRPNVGVMFHLHHWQAVAIRDHAMQAAKGGSNRTYHVGYEALRRDLIKSKPYLMIVVVQGTDESAASHKVVGDGSFEMVRLARTLVEMNYRGPLGTMGFTQRGEIPDKLSRGFKAWQQIRRNASSPN